MTAPERDRDEVNSFLSNLFEDAKLTPGPIERIFVKYLKNWLGREPDDNEKIEIAKIAAMSFGREWKNTSPDTHICIEEACMLAGISEGNLSMNGKVALMSVPVIEGMLEKKRQVKILDIGAGSGDTIGEILKLMKSRLEWGIIGPDIITSCHIYTLEPGYAKIEMEEVDQSTGQRKESKLEKLAKILRRMPIQPRWTPIGDGFESFMPMVSPKYFDLAISSAVMHHIPDPKYWHILRSRVNTDGAVIFGDWYTNIFSHPALMVKTIRDLGISEIGVRHFENYFAIKVGDSELLESGFTPEQKMSLHHMREYIKNLAELLKHKKKKGEDSELLLFEGHHSHIHAVKAAEEAGFTAEKDVLAKHAGGSKARTSVYHMNPGSDISTVFMVVPHRMMQNKNGALKKKKIKVQ